MMGSEDSRGIVPQLNDDLWIKIKEKLDVITKKESSKQTSEKTKFMVTVSFLEVYNEEVKDLLNPSDKKLKIHEHPDLGIYVDGLCELVCIILLSRLIYFFINKIPQNNEISLINFSIS